MHALGAGQAASKAAEVLRKLPDCINKVTPPGPNQIPLERVASGKAAAYTWRNGGHQAQTQQRVTLCWSLTASPGLKRHTSQEGAGLVTGLVAQDLFLPEYMKALGKPVPPVSMSPVQIRGCLGRSQGCRGQGLRYLQQPLLSCIHSV